ncbi:MAG: MerR family transcriptional regulator [Acidimicrobiia bacterium]
MYSSLQAARVAHCSRAQLSHWRRSGLIVPSGAGAHPYTFRDLVALRVVADWLRSGLSSTQVRRAVRFLRDSKADLVDLRLVSDGHTVWACNSDGQVLDALRQGQLALFVAVDGIARELDAQVRDLAAERDAFIHELTDEPMLDLASEECSAGAPSRPSNLAWA